MKRMPEPKILTIVLEEWKRGHNGTDTYLLSPDGLKCCLGFDALARGLKPKDIRGLCGPSDVNGDINPKYAGFMRARQDQIEEAIRANDSISLTDEERMEEVRAAMKKLGWDDVRFV